MSFQELTKSQKLTNWIYPTHPNKNIIEYGPLNSISHVMLLKVGNSDKVRQKGRKKTENDGIMRLQLPQCFAHCLKYAGFLCNSVHIHY